MNTESTSFIHAAKVALSRLGARTLTAMVAALIAAILLVASPEIGIGSAIGGVIVGAISAVLIRPHA